MENLPEFFKELDRPQFTVSLGRKRIEEHQVEGGVFLDFFYRVSGIAPVHINGAVARFEASGLVYVPQDPLPVEVGVRGGGDIIGGLSDRATVDFQCCYVEASRCFGFRGLQWCGRQLSGDLGVVAQAKTDIQHPHIPLPQAVLQSAGKDIFRLCLG
jgi:hypothetical protein